MNGNTAEKTVNRILRDLPDRSAPASLEARVFGELQRRHAALWQRGFTYWPLAMRIAFVAICGVLVTLTLLDIPWPAAGLQRVEAIGDWSSFWASPAVTAITLLGQLAARIVDAVPPAWLYGLMAVGALLYATLFGLGAVAYRALYLSSSMAGDRR